MWWRSFLYGVRCHAPPAAYPGAQAGHPRTPLYVALLRMGFAVPQPLPTARWALTPPFHPGPTAHRAHRVVCFLWHFPQGHPHRVLPGILPSGARTFLLADCDQAIASATRAVQVYLDLRGPQARPSIFPGAASWATQRRSRARTPVAGFQRRPRSPRS